MGHAHDSAQGAVRSVSRQLKSSFVDAGGKRAIAADVSDETPAPKHRRPAAVTPSVSSLRLPLSTPLPPDSVNTRDWGGVFGPSNSGAMLINERNSVVPHHSAHRSSVLQRIYKHLPPHEVVRLSPVNWSINHYLSLDRRWNSNVKDWKDVCYARPMLCSFTKCQPGRGISKIT